MASRSFPKALRIEAKFTTGSSIAVPRREREGLLGKDSESVGAVAALFCSERREVDARWFIVDAAESFRSGGADGGTLTVEDMQRLEKGQSWLSGVRQHVTGTWPKFLRAFHSEALAGHETLCGELLSLKRANKLHTRMQPDRVLDVEHRQAVHQIVDRHGASVAGHVFQDLLAYLLALAGYNKVQLNPIGIPDIELSEFTSSDDSPKLVTLRVTQQQAERIRTMCAAVGDDELLNIVMRIPDNTR